MVAGAVQLLIGALIYLTPKETADLYQVPGAWTIGMHAHIMFMLCTAWHPTRPVYQTAEDKRSPLYFSLLKAMGATVFSMGLYLASLARGLTQPQVRNAAEWPSCVDSAARCVAMYGRRSLPRCGIYLLWQIPQLYLVAIYGRRSLPRCSPAPRSPPSGRSPR